MNRKMPQIREYMTYTPKTIEANTPLKAAAKQMLELKIRHIPVEKDGKLVGVLSDRNAKAALISSIADKLRVEDAMIPDPYVTSPHTSLDEVVSIMAEEKYGCAIIAEANGEIAGIFTTVDACRALREVLQTVFPQ